MPTLGSITKTIRINPRDLEIIEGLMEDGTTWSGAIHKLCEGGRQVNPEIFKDIEIMCRIYGIETDRFFDMVCQSMIDGEIGIKDGKIVKMA